MVLCRFLHLPTLSETYFVVCSEVRRRFILKFCLIASSFSLHYLFVSIISLLICDTLFMLSCFTINTRGCFYRVYNSLIFLPLYHSVHNCKFKICFNSSWQSFLAFIAIFQTNFCYSHFILSDALQDKHTPVHTHLPFKRKTTCVSIASVLRLLVNLIGTDVFTIFNHLPGTLYMSYIQVFLTHLVIRIYGQQMAETIRKRVESKSQEEQKHGRRVAESIK